MAGSINKAIIVGNLGADPDIRRTNDGRPIANFSVATSETWKEKTTGEKKERTEWHRVVVFNEALAKVCEQYIRKGSKVYIEGQIITRKWQDQAGTDRYTTEIVVQGYNGSIQMLDGAKGNGPGKADNASDYGLDSDRAAGGSYAEQSARAGAQSGGDFKRDLDDEIPF